MVTKAGRMNCDNRAEQWLTFTNKEERIKLLANETKQHMSSEQHLIAR